MAKFEPREVTRKDAKRWADDAGIDIPFRVSHGGCVKFSYSPTDAQRAAFITTVESEGFRVRYTEDDHIFEIKDRDFELEGVIAKAKADKAAEDESAMIEPVTYDDPVYARDMRHLIREAAYTRSGDIFLYENRDEPGRNRQVLGQFSDQVFVDIEGRTMRYDTGVRQVYLILGGPNGDTDPILDTMPDKIEAVSQFTKIKRIKGTMFPTEITVESFWRDHINLEHRFIIERRDGEPDRWGTTSIYLKRDYYRDAATRERKFRPWFVEYSPGGYGSLSPDSIGRFINALNVAQRVGEAWLKGLTLLSTPPQLRWGESE